MRIIITRSEYYYSPRRTPGLNLELMSKMDEYYLEHPHLIQGARGMYVWLTKDLGYKVSLNRIEHLYYNRMSLR